MTGRYPRHHGVRWNGHALSENEMTLVELLKQHGYSTAAVGKHHISQKRFREALDYTAGSAIRRNWPERLDGQYSVEDPNEFEQYVRSRGYEYKTGYALPRFRERLGAVPSELPEDCHLDAYVGMRTRQYLEKLDRSKPFALWMGFYGPHHPYVPSGRFALMYEPSRVPGFRRDEMDLRKKPPEYRLYCATDNHKYRGFAEAADDTFREMKAAYYGMVSQLDWQLGLTLDALQSLGLADNTVVVLTSDHGEFLGDHGIPAKAPFLLDCMLHVPCIVRAPGGQGGSIYDGLVESTDLFPTITGLAGLEVPEWVQGRDLAGVVRGSAPAEPARAGTRGPARAGRADIIKWTTAGGPDRAAIYAEAVDKKCIRTHEWKYIHYAGKPYGELYHVSVDPHELDNLYDTEIEAREGLRQQFYELLDQTEDFRHPSYQRFTGEDPETGQRITHYHTW